MSTYQDPIPGWTNNITGINGNTINFIIPNNKSNSSHSVRNFAGLCVGIGVGFLRHLHVTNDFVIDIICADFVINTTLAAIWVCADKYEASVPKRIPEPEIYHATSKRFYLTSGISCDVLQKMAFLSCCDKFQCNAFIWNHLERLGKDSITMRKYELLHSMKCVYYPVITFTHYGWQDSLATIFLQALPCYFMDFFNTEKIRLLRVCRKIKSMKNVIAFFMSKRIHFDNTNVVRDVYNR